MSAVDHDLEEMARAAKPAGNVIEALSRVIRDLPAIGKDGRAPQQQGGYAYRGIEQITNEVAPLFVRHGLVFVPKVVSWDRDEITVANKPWTDDRLMVVYTVYGPGGIEDKIEVGPIPGVGRDNSDKGTNKALTQAFKYALIQALCIADKRDDTDGTTHERDEPVQRDPHIDRVEALRRRVITAGAQEAVKGQGYDWPWNPATCDEIEAFLDGEEGAT